MKKTIIIVLAILVLVCVYFYSMQPLRVSTTATIATRGKTIIRYIDEMNEKQKGLHTIAQKLYDNERLFFQAPFDTSLLGEIKTHSLLPDTSVVICVFEFAKTYNPFTQFSYYQKGLVLKNKFHNLLSHCLSIKNWILAAYGVSFQKESVQYDQLISTKFTTQQRPQTTELAKEYAQLEHYIQQKKATIIGDAMLHTGTNSQGFTTMIAYPINKEITNTNRYFFKRMVKGFILKANITGGQNNIQAGFNGIENYLYDYGLSSPALPYEAFEKQNRLQSDTAKWHTTIYYPVY